jgi:acetyl esterase/lipase
MITATSNSRRKALMAGMMLTVAVACPALAGPASEVELLAAKASEPQPDESLSYVGQGGIEHKIFVFAPKGKVSNRAGVVLYHGGGWKRGEPIQFYRHARFLADRGYVVFLPEYGLESDGVTPIGALRDAASAWEMVQEKASGYGVAPGRIAAGGGSAGGHLAATLAITTGLREKAVLAKPAALVLFNPVIDNGPEGYGFERVGDNWESFSPIHNIAAGHPDALFMVGDRDPLIPVTTAARYCALIIGSGADCRLSVDPGHGHSWFNKAGFVLTLGLMTRFLDEHFEPQADNAND